MTGLSSSILLLSLLTHMWYSSKHLLKEIDGDLGLCTLSANEQLLTSSKLLPISKRLSKGSTTISISWFGVKLLKTLAIAVKESVIFTNSLVGTTMQDSGKRERSDPILYIFLL